MNSISETFLKSMILVNKSELSTSIFTWCPYYSSEKRHFEKRGDHLLIKLNV
jgi:hypothetical protein